MVFSRFPTSRKSRDVGHPGGVARFGMTKDLGGSGLSLVWLRASATAWNVIELPVFSGFVGRMRITKRKS
jgi:hypothetical protein